MQVAKVMIKRKAWRIVIEGIAVKKQAEVPIR